MATVWLRLQRVDESLPLFESEDPQLIRAVVDKIVERVGDLRNEAPELRDLRQEDHDG